MYIDWYSEKMEKQKKSLGSVPSSYKIWKDLVTETQYFISDEMYNHIYAIGIEKIKQYKKQGNLEALEQFFSTIKKMMNPFYFQNFLI